MVELSSCLLDPLKCNKVHRLACAAFFSLERKLMAFPQDSIHCKEHGHFRIRFLSASGPARHSGRNPPRRNKSRTGYPQEIPSTPCPPVGRIPQGGLEGPLDVTFLVKLRGPGIDKNGTTGKELVFCFFERDQDVLAELQCDPCFRRPVPQEG